MHCAVSLLSLSSKQSKRTESKSSHAGRLRNRVDLQVVHHQVVVRAQDLNRLNTDGRGPTLPGGSGSTGYQKLVRTDLSTRVIQESQHGGRTVLKCKVTAKGSYGAGEGDHAVLVAGRICADIFEANGLGAAIDAGKTERSKTPSHAEARVEHVHVLCVQRAAVERSEATEDGHRLVVTGRCRVREGFETFAVIALSLIHI